MFKRTNPAALILAPVAVVIASTGTAVAVTSSVQITDPLHPTQKAKVDTSGRLQTAAPLSGFNLAYYLTAGTPPNFMTAPTKATLAVTRLELTNTSLNSSYPNSDFMVYLTKYTVGADGTCSTGSASATVSRSRVPVASDVQLLFPSPVAFRSVSSKAYCIAIQVSGETGTPGAYYLPFGQLTGYVAGGTFTPPAVAKAPTAKAPLARAGARRPAGTSPVR